MIKFQLSLPNFNLGTRRDDIGFQRRCLCATQAGFGGYQILLRFDIFLLETLGFGLRDGAARQQFGRAIGQGFGKGQRNFRGFNLLAGNLDIFLWRSIKQFLIPALGLLKLRFGCCNLEFQLRDSLSSGVASERRIGLTGVRSVADNIAVKAYAREDLNQRAKREFGLELQVFF